jgi:hypothetical protein
MKRHKTFLTPSAAAHGVDPRTVTRLAPGALKKTSSGRYVAKSSDRLPRLLQMPTRYGLAEIATRSSREATKLAEYWDAVHLFLATGDASALTSFAGQNIKAADGTEHELLTDLDELERLGAAGVFSFESLYARVS